MFNTRLAPALGVFALFLVAISNPALCAPTPRPTIQTLPIPGDARFVRIARDVLLIQSAYAPDFASQSGLMDDAASVPSFAPGRVEALTRRLRRDLSQLRQLPWRKGSVDEQIDVRLVYAQAERMDRELNVERLYLRRPGAWLETLANDYLNILTYTPERHDVLAKITAGVPAMVQEMDRVCEPTQVDADVGLGVLDGIVAILRTQPAGGSSAAIAALSRYREKLRQNITRAPFAVIGAKNYAWRLAHAALLPWDPMTLRSRAEERLKNVDEQIAALRPGVVPPAPLSAELKQKAAELDQAGLLQLYDDIEIEYRAAIQSAGFVTIPQGVGPIRARVTPEATIPLAGDGGSMIPPPPFLDSDVSWWNVEHFRDSESLEEREKTLQGAVFFRENGLGPYAAHEGLPGHHLQLSIARLNADPLRSVFTDTVAAEGWALYAEELMWENKGLGDSVAAHVNTLSSWRSRIRRVIYDVNIETGVWSLQQAADWKSRSAEGQGKIDPEIRRSINWPTQLISYFAGKEQIMELKHDYQAKLGSAYSERGFHDALLAVGPVPYVFARAKLLGEPVPDFDTLPREGD
ncbi:MAG: DUF885 family protein [Burkholderiaceae bacterium]